MASLSTATERIVATHVVNLGVPGTAQVRGDFFMVAADAIISTTFAGHSGIRIPGSVVGNAAPGSPLSHFLKLTDEPDLREGFELTNISRHEVLLHVSRADSSTFLIRELTEFGWKRDPMRHDYARGVVTARVDPEYEATGSATVDEITLRFEAPVSADAYYSFSMRFPRSGATLCTTADQSELFLVLSPAAVAHCSSSHGYLPVRQVTAEFLFGTALAPVATEYGRSQRDFSTLVLHTGPTVEMCAGLYRFTRGAFTRDTIVMMTMLEPDLAPRAAAQILFGILDRVADSGRAMHEAIPGFAAELEAIARERTAAHRLAGTSRSDGHSSTPASLSSKFPTLTLARNSTGELELRDYRMVDTTPLLAIALGMFRTHVAAELSVLETSVEGYLKSKIASVAEYLKRSAGGLVAAWEAGKRGSALFEHLLPFELDAMAGAHVGDWRDSDEGHGAVGVYSGNANAMLLPAALHAMSQSSDELGLGPLSMDAKWSRIWREATRDLFTVRLSAEEAAERLTRYTAWASRNNDIRLPPFTSGPYHVDGRELTFPALSLDHSGSQVAVMSSDIAFDLAYSDLDAQTLRAYVTMLKLPFPAGLMVPGAGVLVSNPAYADPALWPIFTSRHYHGTCIWPPQEGLILVGLQRQLSRNDLEDVVRGEMADLRDVIAACITARDRTLRNEEVLEVRLDHQTGKPFLVPARTTNPFQGWTKTAEMVALRIHGRHESRDETI